MMNQTNATPINYFYHSSKCYIYQLLLSLKQMLHLSIIIITQANVTFINYYYH